MNRASLLLRCAVAGAALFCAPMIIGAQSAPPTSFAITHAKIFTLAGAAIEDGTVVIRDGKIEAIGANVDVPSGAQVIDGKLNEAHCGQSSLEWDRGARPRWKEPCAARREVGADAGPIVQRSCGCSNAIGWTQGLAPRRCRHRCRVRTECDVECRGRRPGSEDTAAGLDGRNPAL